MTPWTDPASPWMAVGAVEIDDEPAVVWPRPKEAPPCNCAKCARIIARTKRPPITPDLPEHIAYMRAYRAKRKARAA